MDAKKDLPTFVIQSNYVHRWLEALATAVQLQTMPKSEASRPSTSSSSSPSTSTTTTPVGGKQGETPVVGKVVYRPISSYPGVCGRGEIQVSKKVEVVVPSEEELASEKVVNIRCPFKGCNKVLVSSPSLQMHFTKVHSSSIQDSSMLQSYLEETGVNLVNEYKKRSREQIFFCPVQNCNRSEPFKNYFAKKHFVKEHFLRQHMEKKFECSRCAAKFALQYDAKKHEEKCGQKHVCECGASYASRQAMVTHAKRHRHSCPEAIAGISRSAQAKIVKPSNVETHSQRSDIEEKPMPDKSQTSNPVNIRFQPPPKPSYVDASRDVPSDIITCTLVPDNTIMQFKRLTDQIFQVVNTYPNTHVNGSGSLTSKVALNRSPSPNKSSVSVSSRLSSQSNASLNSVPLSRQTSKVARQDQSTERSFSANKLTSPVYYVNYGETQTDSPVGQATQTIPLRVERSTTSNATSMFSTDDELSNNTAIQTRFSINPNGKRNLVIPSAKRKKSSGCQTGLAGNKLLKRASNTVSTQTDIAKKRRLNKEGFELVETEVQTSPPPQSSGLFCSVDLQTVPFGSIQSSGFQFDNTAFDNIQADGFMFQQNNIAMSTIQSETQTLPFDFSEFFGDQEVCQSTVGVISQHLATTSVMEEGTLNACGVNTMHEVAVETQTAWSELLQGFATDSLVSSSSLFSAGDPFAMTLSEGTQTASRFPDDLVDWDYVSF